jgi:hypothetical protein
MAGYLLGDLIKRKKRQIRILRYSNLIRRFECGERFSKGSKVHAKFKDALRSITNNEQADS